MSTTAKAVTASPLYKELVSFRRDLHRHPELGLQEVQTARYLRQIFENHGLQVKGPYARTGLSVDIKGDYPGPVIAFRADMDALPIHEEVASSYRSQTDGKMRMPIWARAPLTDR